MKHFTRKNIYKGSNVTFSPETFEAYSYGYWLFTKMINGKLVFNNYNFSITTQGHQRKVRTLLDELGISIDLEVSCPKGLQHHEYFISIDEHYSEEIRAIERKIDAPRSQAKKNIERRLEIEKLIKECVDFKQLDEAA